MSDPSPRRFKVSMSAAQIEQLRAEADRSQAIGLYDEYAAAMREIEFRLTVEPNDWGESRERLPVLRVQLRCGISRMITVLYGVSEERDIVFVREYRVNHRWKPPIPPS